MAAQIMVATSTFLFEHNGVLKHVPQGTTVRVGHPILKGREDLFHPLVVDYEIEQPKAGAK